MLPVVEMLYCTLNDQRPDGWIQHQERSISISANNVVACNISCCSTFISSSVSPVANSCMSGAKASQATLVMSLSKPVLVLFCWMQHLGQIFGKFLLCFSHVLSVHCQSEPSSRTSYCITIPCNSKAVQKWHELNSCWQKSVCVSVSIKSNLLYTQKSSCSLYESGTDTLDKCGAHP